MLRIEFKECCKECDHIDVVHTQTMMRSARSLKEIANARVSCNHAPVCKQFLESNEPWQGQNQT